MYGRKKHLEEQGELEKHNGISRRVWERILQGGKGRSKMARRGRKQKDI